MIALTVRLVVSLAVVVGLLLLTARLGSRRFRSSTGAPVRVVHRQALSRFSSIAVVEVGARTLLLGTTEHQVNLLTDLTGDLPREAGAPVAAGATASSEELPEVEQASFGPHLAAALASRASRATRTSSRLRLADEGAPDTTVVTPRASRSTPPPTPPSSRSPRPTGPPRSPGSAHGPSPPTARPAPTAVPAPTPASDAPPPLPVPPAAPVPPAPPRPVSLLLPSPPRSPRARWPARSCRCRPGARPPPWPGDAPSDEPRDPPVTNPVARTRSRGPRVGRPARWALALAGVLAALFVGLGRRPGRRGDDDVHPGVHHRDRAGRDLVAPAGSATGASLAAYAVPAEPVKPKGPAARSAPVTAPTWTCACAASPTSPARRCR